MTNIELYITGKEKDLGGFTVRRVLPYATHRMVGPFIFFDHMGPAVMPPGQGLDVRPHPHIGLSTVTYLFEGKVRHQDSLGNDQLIVPGEINWMTAGKGIVHSERSPDEIRKSGGPEHGIQCWVALPKEFEDTEPRFDHYSSQVLPEFEVNGAKIKLLVGSALNYKSPVKAHSNLFYLEVKLSKGATFSFPADGREAAAYVVSGVAKIEEHNVEPFTMAVVGHCKDLKLTALEDSHIMVLGGEPIGERFIYWNFVASSKERLEKAKKDWEHGPSSDGRFKIIPGDSSEFIPLPADAMAKGTIM